MTIKQVFKNIEMQNKLRKQLNQKLIYINCKIGTERRKRYYNFYSFFENIYAEYIDSFARKVMQYNFKFDEGYSEVENLVIKIEEE